ncbi:MAG: Ig-like domain-containing protein, partial [Proteobacteria bacterium]|nr:Ig-like domain-containing protein [Pseudomonadota bacterium]
TDSNGSLFSPGTNPNGSYFSGCPVGDLPPTVTATTPAHNDSGVAVDANITITLSEESIMTASAFTLECAGSTLAYTAVLPTTATSITLDPTTDLQVGDFCTVTAVATEITDADEGGLQLDGNGDTVGGDDYSWIFIVGLPDLEIYEIQGNSTVSIYDGIVITTTGNIVTALGATGFYFQTPDNRDDNDPNTSNGMFAYMGNNPLPAVGDEVDVIGTLIEYFELTEFSFPTVTIVSNGNNLPSPILLDDNFPPNDNTPICSTDQATHKYECLENMWFDMPQGFISAASAGNAFFPGANGDDVIVRAGSHRAFREPGIDYPGDINLPDSPIFDGNPELLEMDIDGLTLSLSKYSAGTELAIQGIFGFDFGEYEIWPSAITIINNNVIPSAVRIATASEATVGSANLFRFFDNIDDAGSEDDGTILTTQEFNDRISKLSKYIVNDLQAPMILALQEVENLNSLNQLANKILTDFSIAYTAYLIDGPDPGGINVAYMLRDNVAPSSGFPVQLGTDETQSTNGFTLHDRPPLHLQADITLADGTFQVQILAVHNRSRGKIEDPNPAEAHRVRVKRLEQANSIAAMINVMQTDNPDDAVITIGDFNAFQFTDGYADVMGQITGTAIALENEHWTAPIFANSPLTQAVETLPMDQQYSYIFGGSAQILDNAVLNDSALTMLNEMQFSRGQADANYSYGADATISLRASDHDGFVLFISKDFDLIFSNGFEN